MNKTKKKCPICENVMEEIGSKTIGRVVMGQKANSLVVYQCSSCKRIEIE